MSANPHEFALFVEQKIREAFHTAGTQKNELRYDADEISQGKLFEAMCCLLEFHHIDKAELKEFKKRYSSCQGKYLHEIENLQEIEYEFKSMLK